MNRRLFLRSASYAPAALTASFWAPQSFSQSRSFTPQPGAWRHFEVTTRVELAAGSGASRAWIPLPSVNTDYQQSLGNAWSGNAARARVVADGRYGADMLMAEFAPGESKPTVEVVSRIRTQDRALDWGRRQSVREDAATLAFWTAPTQLMPTDGIVRRTAADITRGKRSDLDKSRAIYDWVVQNTYREPKVRGCGVGDIRAMLESGDLSGKCGDINALFVGLNRAAGIPARDVYGIRVAPSAFGYKELGAGPNITRAQHCRAEVFVRDYGWVATDPADVGKVMRLETPQWIKDSSHAVVAPVKAALFGGWEGNWLAYNTAHDVSLPQSTGPKLGFLMYPQAETAAGRIDPLEPDAFKYSISARVVPA
jgi:transglutaminase-like putative cysteine protease